MISSCSLFLIRQVRSLSCRVLLRHAENHPREYDSIIQEAVEGLKDAKFALDLLHDDADRFQRFFPQVLDTSFRTEPLDLNWVLGKSQMLATQDLNQIIFRGAPLYASFGEWPRDSRVWLLLQFCRAGLVLPDNADERIYHELVVQDNDLDALLYVSAHIPETGSFLILFLR